MKAWMVFPTLQLQLSILLWLLLWLVPVQAELLETADPNATSTTKQLYTYLQSLPSQVDHRLISGQMIWRRPGESTMDYTPIQDVFDTTGQHIGYLGIGDFTADRQFVVDHWNNGGLVGMMYLDGNLPQKRSAPNPVDLTALLTDPLYLAELDILVTGLLEYQNAGVVILFRPWLEMNGKWAWTHGDHDKYITLWRHLFSYVTSRGVHNLLWVYCPNADVGDYMGYYPGDAYVDIVALDYYQSLDEPLPKVGGYDELTATGKPFALGEYGTTGTEGYTDSPVIEAHKDLRYFLEGIKLNMPKTIYWMSWSAPWDLAEQTHVLEVLNDPWVQNRPVPYATSRHLHTAPAPSDNEIEKEVRSKPD